MFDEANPYGGNVAALEHYILSQLEPQTMAMNSDPRHLTVGIEHEFFLLDENEMPATHQQSQKLLRMISLEPGWHVQEKEWNPIFGEMLSRVSKDQTNGRFTALKYDHHPHLMEVAFGYTSSLQEAFLIVSEFFDILDRNAKYLGLKVAHQPQIDISPGDERVKSPLVTFQNLRHYRRILLNKNRSSIGPENDNYAAVIAATQTHIGNTKWWHRKAFVQNLYMFEPVFLALAVGNPLIQESLIRKVLRSRWQGYRAVFFEYPLVGFPNISEWNMKSWLEAMIRSPLCGGSEDSFAGKTISDIAKNPFPDWLAFLRAVRDLQIIRPKMFGTLEFRADPAQPNPLAIIQMSALRLGLCSALLDGDSPIGQFSESRKQWWGIVGGAPFLDPTDLLILSNLGLQKRNLGEEKYLAAFMGKELEVQHEKKAAG